jgi:hypothetical protein
MKQKRELAVLLVLLLIAGAIWFFYFDHDKTTVTADAGSTGQNAQVLSVDNLDVHKAGPEQARKTEYKSSGRNIFSREIPVKPPSPEEIRKASEARPKELPPQIIEKRVSPLPVKFFGFGTVPNGTVRLAFFTDGEETYVVAEGELLLNRFRILKIGNANLEYEEVSSGLRGTANLEDQGGSPSA